MVTHPDIKIEYTKKGMEVTHPTGILSIKTLPEIQTFYNELLKEQIKIREELKAVDIIIIELQEAK